MCGAGETLGLAADPGGCRRGPTGTSRYQPRSAPGYQDQRQDRPDGQPDAYRPRMSRAAYTERRERPVGIF